MLSHLLFAALLSGIAVPALAGNCALWARAETGVELYGAAGGWWQQADGRYQRGKSPAVGAILVFERSRYMPSGHVAVVSQIVGPREILVDQSNWYHGATTRGDSVIDTSASNDWSSVAVVDRRSGAHGRDNAAYGFIYPDAKPGGPDTYLADARPAEGLVRLAVARDEPIEIETGGRHFGHRHHSAHAAARGHHRTATHTGHATHSAHADRHHAAPHHEAPHRLAHHAPPHRGHGRA